MPAIAVVLCLVSSGCAVSPLAKHTAAFSTASNLVIDNSTTAYQSVQDLHDQEQIATGILLIEQGQTWDPHNVKPLISPEGMKARLAVLAALKAYAQDLSDLTSGLDSKALQSAAAADGSSLKDLGTSLGSEPGLTSLGLSVSPQVANGASTASLALAEWLSRRIVKREVPAAIKAMDPNIQALCSLLTDDVDTLSKTSHRDFEELIALQTVYVRTNAKSLSASDLHTEVAKLPALVRSEQTSDAMLADLHKAIARLALTHHALAAEAQGNNPEALKSRIADLVAAGQSLGTYYKGLPTS